MSGVPGVDGAPHGRVFYGFVVLFGLAGGLFFGAASLTQATDASIGWRVAFAVPAVMFFFGAAQGAERLGWPRRAQVRAAGWRAAVRERLVWSRWIVLMVAVGGAGALTVLRHFVSPEEVDVCDDLRVLCWTLLFFSFCLADLAGERMLDASTLRDRWASPPSAPLPPPPRRSRRRRSGLTVQDGPR